MADSDPKGRKFFFDVNNFDDAAAVEPPPVFSVLEMEMARQESFEQGRKTGHAEAKALREKFVADQLEVIKNYFSALFNAEKNRDALYEAETLFLARAIFDRLFPGLNKRHGLDEVMRTIVTVLESQRTRAEIIIEVHPDYADAVRQHIAESLKSVDAGICTVSPNPAMAPGDCHMRWEDGGAGRSASKISKQIGQVFEQTLADRPILRDNEEERPILGDTGETNG